MNCACDAANAAVTDWYLSASGIPTASGTDAAHPIPPAELSRRLAGLTVVPIGPSGLPTNLLTLHYDAAGDPTGGLVISWNLLAPTQMIVFGTPTLTGTSGTLTAWTAIDHSASPKSYGFEDSALPAANAWSAFVGNNADVAPRRIRITSGPRAGLCMAVLKDENTNVPAVPKTARVAPPYKNPAFTFPIQFWNAQPTIPALGDPYVVESLPNIGWVRNTGVNVNGTAQIFFKDVAFSTSVGTSVSLANGEFTAFYDCHHPWVVSVGPTALYGGSCEYAEARAGLFQATGVGITDHWDIYSGTHADISDCLFQGATLNVNAGSRVSCHPGLQFFDSPGAPLIVFGLCNAGNLSGNKNAKGALLNSGGRLTWGMLPTLQNNTGTGSAVLLDGAASPWGDGYIANAITGTNVHPAAPNT